MNYQSLYRKYRPKSFEEIYGQAIAKKIIMNSLNNNKISHAYLFFGPRGTGKTSTAKMFAKMCNCLNFENGKCCEKCQNCIDFEQNYGVDVMEIDAASNNGVDEIRELKNKINLVPNKLKYKVYIIDEVHMLSTGAFNALLKTLEEPPEHVIFILATTEFYKVPSTIISRCQNIEFKCISLNEMTKNLKRISKLEKINIQDDAIIEIAQFSNGGLRDAIGLLEKVSLYSENEICKTDVQDCIGIISDNDIQKIYNQIENNKIDFEYIKKITEEGRDLFKILQQLLIFYKNQLLKSENFNLIEKIKIINDYQEKMKKNNDKATIFEIMFFDLINKTNVRNIDTSDENNTDKEKNKSNINLKNTLTNFNGNKKIDIKIRINNSFATADKNDLINIKENWKKLKNFAFDLKNGAMICDLMDTSPIVCGKDNLMLVTDTYILKEKINNQYIEYEKAIFEVLGFYYKIIVVSSDDWKLLKAEYVENTKKGVKYKYLDEKTEKVMNLTEKNDKIIEGDLIEKAIDLFGNIQ